LLENEYAQQTLLNRFKREVDHARDALCEQLSAEWQHNRALEEDNLAPDARYFDEGPFEDLMLWHNTLRLRAYDIEWNKKFINFRNSLSVGLSHDEACSSFLRDSHIEALWDGIRCAYFGDDELPEV
jgi:hypothetical protein